MRKNNLLGFFVFCHMNLVPCLGRSQPDIPINHDLKSNAANWKVKVKQNGIWGKKPALVSFGQLKTISAESGKSGESIRELDREFFWKKIRTVNSRETMMELDMGDKDTAIVSMLAVNEEKTREKNTLGTLTNVNGNGEESYQDSSWVDDMIIQFYHDSTRWHYHKLSTDTALWMLENIADTAVRFFLRKVNNWEGKKMKDIMFSQPAVGFVFVLAGNQVAAVQTLLKQMIWVSNALDPVQKNAVMATAAAILATVKSGNQNGF